MSRTLLWLAGLGVSVIAILAAAFGPYGIALASLLVVPFVRRPDGRVALSGLLTGFGAIWLMLLTWQHPYATNDGCMTLLGGTPHVNEH